MSAENRNPSSRDDFMKQFMATPPLEFGDAQVINFSESPHKTNLLPPSRIAERVEQLLTSQAGKPFADMRTRLVTTNASSIHLGKTYRAITTQLLTDQDHPLASRTFYGSAVGIQGSNEYRPVSTLFLFDFLSQDPLAFGVTQYVGPEGRIPVYIFRGNFPKKEVIRDGFLVNIDYHSVLTLGTLPFTIDTQTAIAERLKIPLRG